jgi:hypothetical protein
MSDVDVEMMGITQYKQQCNHLLGKLAMYLELSCFNASVDCLA